MVGDLLIMAGLIWGFLGTMLGLPLWLAAIDDNSMRAGRTFFLICAPMWFAAYKCLPYLGHYP